MIETIGKLLPCLLAGMILGAIFFGGLWLSIRHLLRLKHAPTWFLISFVIRNLIVLAGFYRTMDGQWEQLVVALIGFTLARVLFARHAGQNLPSRT